MTARIGGRRTLTVAALIAALIGVTANAAFARWSTTGKGTGSVSTTTLNPATSVAATTAGSISWTNSTSTGTVGAPITYRAERSDVANPDLGARTWTTACAAPATSPCTDSTFPTAVGSYQYVYRVVALRNAFWTANSTESSLVAFTIAAATKLVLTGAVTGSASSSPTLGPITVTSQTAAGAAANAPTGGYVVALSSNSTGTAKFAATSGGTVVTSVTIPVGSSSATFFYSDTKAGSPTITAATAGLTSATQAETINAGAPTTMTFVNCSKPALNASCSGQPISVGNNSSMTLNIDLSDSFGNLAKPASTVSISLSSANTGFYTVNTPVTVTSSQTRSAQITISTGGTQNATDTAITASATGFSDIAVHAKK